MTATQIPASGAARPHARWLHELRSVVSTASVAAAMGRQLVHDDARTAEDVLCEAERALEQCRDLLTAAAEHVRTDAAEDFAAAILVPRTGPEATRAVSRETGRAGRRRSDAAPRLTR